MKDREYRKDWAQEAALAKLRELRGQGRPLTWIAAETGVSAQFIGAVLREEDPKPVSKKIWEAMVSKGWVPGKPGAIASQPTQTSKVDAPEGLHLDAALYARLIARMEQSDIMVRDLSRMLKEETAERRRLQRELDTIRSGAKSA